MTSAGDARHAAQDGAGAGPSSTMSSPRLSPAFVEAVAGLTAGSAATLVVHPLDIVKTRMQKANGGSSARPSTSSVVRSLLGSPRPLAALYRGLTPNLLGNGTSWAAFFFFKSRMETLMKATVPQGQDLKAHHYFVASGLAGACVQILTNPLWVLKTRMLSSDRHAAGAYPSMWAGARHILREEGWHGFYRGLGVSLIGVSHGAVQFAVYDPLKRLVLGYERKRGKDTAQARNESTLVVSSVAKLVAGAVTYPYQVVRSRLQNYNAEARFGRGIVGVSRQIWREDGVRGFYRGLVPSVVRVMPATWVTFLVYENVKYYLPRWADRQANGQTNV